MRGSSIAFDIDNEYRRRKYIENIIKKKNKKVDE